MIKLSDLQSYERIIDQDNGTIKYVEELKKELKKYPNDKYGKYYTTFSNTLKFNAKDMIEEFIQSYEESGDGYEDMTERCMVDISDEDIKKVQDILDKISLSTESFVTYTPDDEINIWE